MVEVWFEVAGQVNKKVEEEKTRKNGIKFHQQILSFMGPIDEEGSLQVQYVPITVKYI
jgi:hypothetical protein